MLTAEQKAAIARVGAICGEYAISKNTAKPVNPRNPRPVLKFVYSDGARIYGTNGAVMFSEPQEIPAGFYTPAGQAIKESPFLSPLGYAAVIPSAAELREPDVNRTENNYFSVKIDDRQADFNLDLIRQAADFLNGEIRIRIAPDCFRLVLTSGNRVAVIAALKRGDV